MRTILLKVADNKIAIEGEAVVLFPRLQVSESEWSNIPSVH